jgi:hypothetical protein
MAGPVRLAVVGGRRGGAFNRALEAFRERVQLVAVCDLSEAMLARWREQHPGIATFTSYDRLLDDPSVDAVLIATPWHIHAATSGARADNARAVDEPTGFGALAVAAMPVFHAPEARSLAFVLAFAGACLAWSAKGFVPHAGLLAAIEVVRSGVAPRRRWTRRAQAA